MKVYVNAGHDRQLDSGAVNPRLDLRECDAAYELACLVMSYLKDNGIAVCFGQNDDLYAVCDEANGEDCDLFISLHFNAFNGRASGTETLISGSTGSLMLGHCIQSNLKAVLNLPNRGLNDCDWRRYEAHKDAAARAIATGIMQYPAQMKGAALWGEAA